ncbi:WYL domain-containing protein [Virgibacillus ainsalahensis]
MEDLLRRAVDKKQKLEMIYIASDNQISQRVIRVLQVTDESILAYCFTKKEVRTFKRNNILSAELLKGKVGA